ncbi:replication protein [Salmonella enterica]|nr:replication protein [Salmonella enterica]EHL6881124.1 replication protein [Salmonella enterica]EHL6896096.1 replication protein [Salmonella enterica]EHL6909906.1 replication protein [Salmonella enterica]EIB2628732.1 replication protein [Salmonella enterica]
MRDYATISPQFWLGETGRKLRKMGAETQVVAFYLMTSPHANMLGLYYLPVLYLAHETGLDMEGASKGLRRATEAGFCSYDEETEMVWVHEMASYQIGRSLSAGDKRCAGVRNEYAALPENPFLPAFYDKYQHHYHLDVKRESSVKNASENSDVNHKKGRGLEGAYKALRSQDQEQDQDQDQEQDQNLLRGAEKISPTQPDEKRGSCGLNLHDGTRPAHAGPERRPLSAGVPSTPRPDDPEFIRLPLNDGAEFTVTESQIAEFETLYPAVNVRQALRNQRGWLLSDPRRRKTARGIRKFITGWLAKDQDRGGNRGRDSPALGRDISPPDNTIPPGFRG